MAANWMTEDEVAAVRDAVSRELVAGSVEWDEIKDLSLADLARSNQDALIDDLFEDHPDDREHRQSMKDRVTVYDRLLGTDRAAELADLPEPAAPAGTLSKEDLTDLYQLIEAALDHDGFIDARVEAEARPEYEALMERVNAARLASPQSGS